MTVNLRREYRERVLWHLLGTGSGVALGDRTRIENAMDAIPNTRTRCGIYEALDLCDLALSEMRKGYSGLVSMSAEVYAGDVSRTVAKSIRGSKARQELEESYHTTLQNLSRRLCVPSEYATYERGGADWV